MSPGPVARGNVTRDHLGGAARTTGARARESNAVARLAGERRNEVRR